MTATDQALTYLLSPEHHRTDHGTA